MSAMSAITEKFSKIEALVSEWLSPLIPESLTKRALLIGASVGLVVYYVTKKRYKLPPGPRALPLVGNLLSLRNVNFYKKMAEWENEFGPAFTLNLGPMQCIILNNLEVIQEAFVQKSADFAGRPKIYSFGFFSEGYKDIVFTDYGPTWQLHRRLALKALKYYMKGDRFDQTMRDALEMGMEEMRKEKEAFNIMKHLEFIIFNTLSRICFNEKFSSDDEEFGRFCEIMNLVNDELGAGFMEDYFPPLRICPTPKFRKFMGLNDELLSFIYKRVNYHRETFSPDVQRDFTDAMLLAQSEAAEEYNPELLAEITDTHIGQTVSDIFQAGVDTSRQTLYWAILHIVAHPKVQDKIHQEVDTVLGDCNIPSLADRHKLPYTEAVLYESMRLGSVGSVTIPHTTTCDTTIGDYELPKGTIVLANLYAVLHDPRHWKNPQEFKPERFLDSSGKMIPKPEAWMPFSTGKRACLAESLAKPELHLILAAILKNFEICMPEGVTADIEPQDNGLVIQPNPYKVVMKSR